MCGGDRCTRLNSQMVGEWWAGWRRAGGLTCGGEARDHKEAQDGKVERAAGGQYAKDGVLIQELKNRSHLHAALQSLSTHGPPERHQHL